MLCIVYSMSDFGGSVNIDCLSRERCDRYRSQPGLLSMKVSVGGQRPKEWNERMLLSTIDSVMKRDGDDVKEERKKKGKR